MRNRGRSYFEVMRSVDWRILFAVPILGLAVIFATFGEVITPYPSGGYDYRNILSSPSFEHWMGTDELGRDVLSRLIVAARTSVLVSIGATSIAAILGTFVGLIVTFAHPRVERAVSSVADILIALPDIFFAILVMSLLSADNTILTVTIGIIYTPQFTKIVSAMAISARNMDYVAAARSMGASQARILLSDILPNILPIIVVKVTLTISSVMLLEASLSFLGLGAAPPATSWGQMVGSLKPYIYNNPWPILFPSLMIFLVIMAVNVFGDWLQDHLNPEVK